MVLVRGLVAPFFPDGLLWVRLLHPDLWEAVVVVGTKLEECCGVVWSSVGWVNLCGSWFDELWSYYSLVFTCIVMYLRIEVSCYNGGCGSGLGCDVLVYAGVVVAVGSAAVGALLVLAPVLWYSWQKQVILRFRSSSEYIPRSF